MIKRCSKCKIQKDVSEFGRHKARKDGLHPQCKVCKSENNRQSYLKKIGVTEIVTESVTEKLLNDVTESVTPKTILKRTQEDDDFWANFNG